MEFQPLADDIRNDYKKLPQITATYRDSNQPVRLNPVLLEQMTRAAGFTRFRQHDFEDPANLYYEVRP